MNKNLEKRNRMTSNLCIGFFSIAILATSLCMTLYADDYNYAIYFKQGASRFWELTWQHYTMVNGRALVHFLCELVLLFDTKLFACLNPILLILISFLFARTMGRENTTSLLWYEILLSLILIVDINIVIARETLFWITGSFNYLLPTILAVGALAVVMRTSRRGKVKAFEIVVCFLCGATTEQGGLIAFTLVCCYYWYLTVTKMRSHGRRDGCFLLPGCILLGYLSVLLAPGTLYRTTHGVGLVERIINGDLFGTYMQISRDIFGPDGFAIIIALFFIGLGVLRIFKKNLPGLMYLGFAVGSAVFFCSLYPVQAAVYALLSGVAVLFMAYLAVVLFKSKKYHMISFYLIAAIFSQGILLFVEKQMIRTVFPTALLLIACLSHISVEIVTKCLKQKWLPACFCTFSLVGLILFLPTLNGYYQNAMVIHNNEKSIREYAVNGKADYSLDLIYPYYYTMFYENGSFVPSFYQYHELPQDAKIYYQSQRLPVIVVDGVQATYPALSYDGATYLPMQPILVAGGGNVSWTPETTEIAFRGKQYRINNDTLQLTRLDTGEVLQMGPLMKLEYGRQYLPEENIYGLFGLRRQTDSPPNRIILTVAD